MSLPLCEKISRWLEPPQVLTCLQKLPYPFLLDSATLVEGLGHHSFIGADPFLVVSSRGRQITIKEGQQSTSFTGSIMAVLKDVLNQYALPPLSGPFPFSGGAVGYFSYDLGRQLISVPNIATNDLQTPDVWLAFYDTIVVADMHTQELFIVSTGLPQRGPAGEQRANARLKKWQQYLQVNPNPDFSMQPKITPRQGSISSNFTPAQYRGAVEEAITQMKAENIKVINLTQRFCTPQTQSAWSIYQKLRAVNPAPMAAYLSCDEMEIISASPERLLKVTGSVVETRPIKGTRPRGATPLEDDYLRRQLWESQKDRVELQAVVDNECNYLRQICAADSVLAAEDFRVETYATVFQLVATVAGRLLPGKNIVDILEIMFPGGSITGVPKIKAMAMIEGLESVRRGIYTGALGYIGFDGQADLNVVIRTILATNGQLYFQVGGGITTASDPHQEYLETLDKAKALVQAMGLETAWHNMLKGQV